MPVIVQATASRVVFFGEGPRTIDFCNTLSFRKIRRSRVRGPYLILSRNNTVILNRNNTVILNRNNTVILNEVKDLEHYTGYCFGFPHQILRCAE